MAAKHMAIQMTKFAPVLYVDPPLSIRAAARRPELAKSLAEPALRLIAPGIARLTPRALPGFTRPGIHKVNSMVVRNSLREALGKLQAVVAAMIVVGLRDIFGASREGLKVVYATDDFRAGAGLMGVPRRRLEGLQLRHAAEADLVVAVTPSIASQWENLGKRCLLLPNGCDHAHFRHVDEALIPDDVHLPSPIAGFMGQLSDRIDLELLEAVARRGRSLLLIGPKQRTMDKPRLSALLSMPTVQWVGAKPFESLPSYLRMMHVGLVPYRLSEFNKASYPLKVLEYLAAGRAAISTELPAVKSLRTGLVHLASTCEEFADLVEHHLQEPQLPQTVAARQRFAAEHSWSVRAAQLAEALGMGHRAR